MKDIQFVSANGLENIEQYASSLLTGMISLRTLESFHLVAFKKGLLDEDELETGKTICWEIQRLISLYKAQMQHVLDRSEVKEDEIINNLRAMMPGVKIPRKRKNIKKDNGKSTPESNNV